MIIKQTWTQNVVTWNERWNKAMNVKALLCNYIFHCTQINVWHKKGSMYCFIRSLFYIRQQRVYYLSARKFLEKLAFREKKNQDTYLLFCCFVFISELWDLVNLCTTEPHIPMEQNYTQILNRLSNKLYTWKVILSHS